MTGRAVWAIGLEQCVNWGVLYYAFGVLVVHTTLTLGQDYWQAHAAPTVLRNLDITTVELLRIQFRTRPRRASHQ